MNIATMDVIHDRTCVVSKQENLVFFFRGSSCRFFVQNTCNYFVASCFRIGFRRVNSLFDGLNCWCKCVVIRRFNTMISTNILSKLKQIGNVLLEIKHMNFIIPKRKIELQRN